MAKVAAGTRIRPLDELDIGAIVRIDERITGKYRPEVWEQRVGYYLRRDPEASRVAEVDGKVVGFMLGDVRAGEFGLEQPSGWIERFGIDPAGATSASRCTPRCAPTSRPRAPPWCAPWWTAVTPA